MTEQNINQPQASHTDEHIVHSCHHKSGDEGLWQKTKETAEHVGHKTAEKSGDMWEATKDVSAKAWEKTKEVGSGAWEATKNFAGNVGDALTGKDDDEDEIEAYYFEDDEYLDDEDNEHLNRENKRINDEYTHIHHGSTAHNGTHSKH